MGWRAIWLAGLVGGGLGGGGGAGEGELEKPRRVTLTRDLSAFPAGEYEVVQSYSLEKSRKVERRGEETVEKTFRQKQDIVFDMVYRPPAVEADEPAGRIAFTLRRLSVHIVTFDGKEHRYDSDGEPGEQGAALRKQFKHVVGRTSDARVTAERFGPFAGLDAGWDRFAEESGWSERSVARNKASYGDARLSRMLSRGQEYLGIPSTVEVAGEETGGDETGGEETGAAPARRSVTRTVGETWRVERPHQGSDGREMVLEHECTLQSVEDGYGVIRVQWHVNELRPKTDESGAVTCTGMDEKCTQVITVHLASGVVTEWTSELSSARQKAVLSTQVTVRSTETDSLRLVRR